MSSSKSLPELRTATLRESIVDLLADAILSGKFQPGDRLNESELGRQMRVSRAPIREALQQLHEQGLVMNQPRRGMFVVSLSPEEVEKINRLRIVLEAEALVLARRGMDPQREKKLLQQVDRMERAGVTSGLDAMRMDLTFHKTIWNQSDNEFLERTLFSLTAPLFAFGLVRGPEKKLKMILDSHRPLFDYVTGQYPEKHARRVMLEHITFRWGAMDVAPADLTR